MADGWLNHEQYQAYGYETIEAADFPRVRPGDPDDSRAYPLGEPPPLRTLPA